MGAADDAREMLVRLLDTDQSVRSRALDYLNHVVHHQNTLYEATIPAALYVAGILTDPRTQWHVDKRHDVPGLIRAELLDWLGSVAREADDEAEAASRRHGFPPEDHPPFTGIRRIRPQLFIAVSGYLRDPDLRVRVAAITACIPLLDDSRLVHHRQALVPLLRQVLAASERWQHQELAIETLQAWDEDTSGLEVRRNPFEFCDAELGASGWGAATSLASTGVDDPPF
ncbi:hypothetical protein DEJ50_32975 [Streptomyces venezuelae]|uniref:HEAT repeat domain-containing protein n=2 Tax=Streptomyces venezuelae TaxID=54571 RepID=A0A5P2D9Z4_STRVZ|nr:hypothetical protein DEJ50_32975 [Streptomyces venezuelae]